MRDEVTYRDATHLNKDQKVHRYEVSERKEKNHETFQKAHIMCFKIIN